MMQLSLLSSMSTYLHRLSMSVPTPICYVDKQVGSMGKLAVAVASLALRMAECIMASSGLWYARRLRPRS